MRVKHSALTLAVGSVLAYGSLTACSAANSAPAAPAISAQAANPAPIPFATAPNYRGIVAANRAAVVGITIEAKASAMHSRDDQDDSDDDPQDNNSPFGGQDPFFRFFGNGPRQQPRNAPPVHALGSGFIVRSDGLILTNAHVVKGATEVTVTLADHHEYAAKVLGMDPTTDVAVLKIDATNLPVVHAGSTDGLEVGDYVLAIGAPYGLEETATAGIVSAKGRSLPDSQSVPFIQTDVAVNPGNSGGPLFDAHGNVVGINSQIYSSTGGYQGLSFAIPIEVAAQAQEQILKTGHVEHARLGVGIQPVTQQLAQSFGLDTPAGALVAKVDDGSAAARAGLKAGDVILKFDGKAVSDPGSLSAAVAMAHPGQPAKLDVWREGRAMQLDVTLGAVPGKAVKVADTQNGAGQGRLGLSVRPLNDQERQQTGGSAGLLVQEVSGPAARAGITPGDVVLAVDGTPVSSATQLRGIIDKHSNTLALLIQRGDSRIFVPVKMG